MQKFLLKTKNPLKNTYPTTVYSGTHHPVVQQTTKTVHTPSNLLSNDEFQRRNNLIKQLHSEFKFKPKDHVKTTDPQDPDVYEITHIDKDWFAYKGREVDESKVPWDESPKIVGAINLRTQERVIATTNYWTNL